MRDMVVTINRDDRVATSVANEQEKERREKRNVAHYTRQRSGLLCAWTYSLNDLSSGLMSPSVPRDLTTGSLCRDGTV